MGGSLRPPLLAGGAGGASCVVGQTQLLARPEHSTTPGTPAQPANPHAGLSLSCPWVSGSRESRGRISQDHFLRPISCCPCPPFPGFTTPGLSWAQWPLGVFLQYHLSTACCPAPAWDGDGGA